VTDTRHRRLVPVACVTVWGVPDGTHLSVEEWVPKLGEWVTGLALCGQSAEQGALDPTTPIDCGNCEDFRDGYERALSGRPTVAQEQLDKLDARWKHWKQVAKDMEADRDRLIRKLDRIEEMAAAWEQRFPGTIRTAAVVEALRIVIKEQ
jgi:hypothetical protein